MAEALHSGVDAGWVKPIIRDEFPLKDAAHSHHEVMEHKDPSGGKLILSICWAVGSVQTCLAALVHLWVVCCNWNCLLFFQKYFAFAFTSVQYFVDVCLNICWCSEIYVRHLNLSELVCHNQTKARDYIGFGPQITWHTHTYIYISLAFCVVMQYWLTVPSLIGSPVFNLLPSYCINDDALFVAPAVIH